MNRIVQHLLGLIVSMGLASPGLAATKPSLSDSLPRVPSPERIAAGATATHHLNAVGGRWLVVGAPGTSSARVARQSGVVAVAPAIGVYRASSRQEALRFVAALKERGLYRFMEPDVPVRPAAVKVEPAEAFDWWRTLVIPGGAAPAPPWATPSIGVIESGVDRTHPDLATANISVSGVSDPTDSHGTAVTALISAPMNGVGIGGFWPQAKVRVYADGGTCATVVAALYRAIKDRVQVINMSYSFPYDGCASHLVATQYAYGLGIVLVAAAGNGFLSGNPLLRPANDPHVITVGSIDQALQSSIFSNENTGLDVVAPGEDIVSATPVPLDTTDGDPDGYEVVSGTSFAAPLVTAATGWLRARKPWLSASQASELIRRSAVDLGPGGWDKSYGFGLVSVSNALRAVPPPNDPWEPNDDIEWIDGRRFVADTPLLARKARAHFAARIDQDEDPIDVYPVMVAAKSRLIIDVRISGQTDVDLAAFRRPLGSVFGWRAPSQTIGMSRRAGGAPERLVIVNSGVKRRVIYVTTWVAKESAYLDATYRVSLRRVLLR